MHWYGGSIAEAVNLSKQRNAIFVVFIEGDNDLSAEMAATIDDGAVLSRLSDQANFLAIKLKSGSPDYLHFAQIYQFVPVPSLFFIGRNGMPLDVVCAGVQPSNMASRIDRILGEHFKDKPSNSSSPTVQASTSSTTVQAPTQGTGFQQNAQQTVNFVQTEAAALQKQVAPPTEETESASGSPPPKMPKTDSEDTKTLVPEDMICDGDVCVRRPAKPDEPGPSQAPTPSLPDAPANPQETNLQATESGGSVEEKMERARELIEARRREKAEKEKELEKEKEIERRNAGKGVAELKRWQADQEMKQIQEERRREKMENNLARQRILEQIAQDRAERRARDLPPAAPAQPQPAVQPTPSDVAGRARIQFKLPDGTSHTAHFDGDDTLRDVQRYVTDNLQLSSSNFSLWTAFPRRELTEPAASLRGLQLAPSAALLVLPRRTAAVVARPSSVSSLITFFTQLFTTIILEPSQNLVAWLRARLFPPPTSPPRASSPSPSPSPPAAPAPPGGARRRGNIHRLPSDRAPDDDNNTWNGNSTQQM